MLDLCLVNLWVLVLDVLLVDQLVMVMDIVLEITSPESNYVNIINITFDFML